MSIWVEMSGFLTMISMRWSLKNAGYLSKIKNRLFVPARSALEMMFLLARMPLF